MKILFLLFLIFGMLQAERNVLLNQKARSDAGRIVDIGSKEQIGVLPINKSIVFSEPLTRAINNNVQLFSRVLDVVGCETDPYGNEACPKERQTCTGSQVLNSGTAVRHEGAVYAAKVVVNSTYPAAGSWDNCEGGSRNWSNAKAYCAGKGQRLPAYNETLANGGIVPACSGIQWTWTIDIHDSNDPWIWDITPTGNNADDRMSMGIRCVDSVVKYNCPSGGVLSGAICNLDSYVCPTGYTDNGTNCKLNYSYYTYHCPIDIDEHGNPWIGPVINSGGDCQGVGLANGFCNLPIPPNGNCVRNQYSCPTTGNECILGANNSTPVENAFDGYIYKQGSSSQFNKKLVEPVTCPETTIAGTYSCQDGWILSTNKCYMPVPLTDIKTIPTDGFTIGVDSKYFKNLEESESVIKDNTIYKYVKPAVKGLDHSTQSCVAEKEQTCPDASYTYNAISDKCLKLPNCEVFVDGKCYTSPRKTCIKGSFDEQLEKCVEENVYTDVFSQANSTAGTGSVVDYAAKVGSISTYTAVASYSTYTAVASYSTYTAVNNVSTYTAVAGTSTYAAIINTSTYSATAGCPVGTTLNTATGLCYDGGNGQRNWSDANSLCIGKGMRLPTFSETAAFTVGGIPSSPIDFTWTNAIGTYGSHGSWVGVDWFYEYSGTLCAVRCVSNKTYSCPNGGTLSGTTCTISTPTCPSGGTLSGTTCTISAPTCPNGGTLSGTTCTISTPTCPSGGTLSGTTCTISTPTCPNGGTLSGTTCTISTPTCPNGGTLSGTTCTVNTLACPTGYTDNGTNCKKTINYTYYNYSCPIGTPINSGGDCLKMDPDFTVINSSLSSACNSATPPVNNCKTTTSTCGLGTANGTLFIDENGRELCTSNAIFDCVTGVYENTTNVTNLFNIFDDYMVGACEIPGDCGADQSVIQGDVTMCSSSNTKIECPKDFSVFEINGEEKCVAVPKCKTGWIRENDVCVLNYKWYEYSCEQGWDGPNEIWNKDVKAGGDCNGSCSYDGCSCNSSESPANSCRQGYSLSATSYSLLEKRPMIVHPVVGETINKNEMNIVRNENCGTSSETCDAGLEEIIGDGSQLCFNMKNDKASCFSVDGCSFDGKIFKNDGIANLMVKNPYTISYEEPTNDIGAPTTCTIGAFNSTTSRCDGMLCPNGGTLSGSTCSKSCPSVSYSCPNGGSLSGSTCLKNCTSTTYSQVPLTCSSSFTNTYLRDLYVYKLNRCPDSGGYAWWMTNIAAGVFLESTFCAAALGNNEPCGSYTGMITVSSTATTACNYNATATPTTYDCSYSATIINESPVCPTGTYYSTATSTCHNYECPEGTILDGESCKQEISSSCKINGRVGWNGRTNPISVIGNSNAIGTYTDLIVTGSADFKDGTKWNGFNAATMALKFSNGHWYSIANVTDTQGNAVAISKDSVIRSLNNSYYNVKRSNSNPVTCMYKNKILNPDLCGDAITIKSPEEKLELVAIADIETIELDFGGVLSSSFNNETNLTVNNILMTSGAILSLPAGVTKEKTDSDFDSMNNRIRFWDSYQDGYLGFLEFVNEVGTANRKLGFVPEFFDYELAMGDGFTSISLMSEKDAYLTPEAQELLNYTYFIKPTITTATECSAFALKHKLTSIGQSNFLNNPLLGNLPKILGITEPGVCILFTNSVKIPSVNKYAIKKKTYTGSAGYVCSKLSCKDNLCGLADCPTGTQSNLFPRGYHLETGACTAQSCDYSKPYGACGIPSGCPTDVPTIFQRDGHCLELYCTTGSMNYTNMKCESLGCPPNTTEVNGKCVE